MPFADQEASGEQSNQTEHSAPWAMGCWALRFGALLDVWKTNHFGARRLRAAEACGALSSATRRQQQISARATRGSASCWDCQEIWLARSKEETNEIRLPEEAACHHRANGRGLRSLRPRGSSGASGAPPERRRQKREGSQRMAVSLGYGSDAGHRLETTLSFAVRKLSSGRTL